MVIIMARLSRSSSMKTFQAIGRSSGQSRSLLQPGYFIVFSSFFSFWLIFLGAGVWFLTEWGKNCSLVCYLFISHLLHEGDKSIALGFQGLGVSHYAAVPENNHFKILCFGRSQEFLWLKIGTYEISPNGRKASRRLCVSISGLRSPTNMW